MFDRLISALVALSLALLVWLYMRSRDQEVLDNVPIPVQITLAAGQSDQYELEVNGPSQVPVSFTGPPSRIRELRGVLQRGELRADVVLSVPENRLDESRYLDTVRVEASDLHAPPGVMPILLEGRNRIPVTLHRLIERRLPVQFEHTGKNGVSQVVVEPASVLVRGPQEVLEQARVIATQPCTLPVQAENTFRPEVVRVDSLPLAQEINGRRVRVAPGSVRARVTIQPQQKLYELAEVPVHFLCPAGFALRPIFNDERAGKIPLRVVGPAGDEPPQVLAFIELSGKKWEPGLYEEKVKLHLPKDFQLAQNEPRLVAFQLVPVENGTKGVGASRAP